jgi:hypothetical protein
MARRRISLAAARTGRGDGAGDSTGVRRGSCRALGGLYRARRGGEPRPDGLAINVHGGGRRLYCLHEGKALIRRNGRGIKEGEISRGFRALYGEN